MFIILYRTGKVQRCADLHFGVNECEVPGMRVNFDGNKSHINVIFVGGARCIDRVVKFATL